MIIPAPTFAVHISDGVLTAPWLAGGFAMAAVLALIGSIRIRDEEIPRIALLTAAFFVASLLHIRVGPTSVHLLLNGLVGVILGWRAALAIPVGLFLQVALIGHGGFLTLGINACVMDLPALVAGGVFSLVCRRAPDLDSRRQARFHLAVGCLVGGGAVALTALLNALVLLWGGAEDWRALVVVVLLAHLPLVAVEGLVVGCTVSFLARVKPEMLAGAGELWRPAPLSPPHDAVTLPAAIQTGEEGTVMAPASTLPLKPPVMLLAAVTLFLAAGTADAHRLKAEYKVLPKEKKIAVESWFETGDSPKNAIVQVFGSDNRLLVEGKLNDEGVFTFRYDEPDTLRIAVSAAGGHRNELTIRKQELNGAEGESPPEKSKPSDTGATIGPADDSSGRFADRSSRTALKDVLLGIGLLLALAGFVLGVRNARDLRALRRSHTPGKPGAKRETPPPATPPTEAFRR
jgi:cobalt/nickel transport system permease protein